MKAWVTALLCLCALVALGSTAVAAEGMEVYPVPALFVSDKVLDNQQFARAISSDGSGKSRDYAIGRFLKTFAESFPTSKKTIDAQNRYSTFAVYLQVPRVSIYRVVKSETLVDLYLPMTMTISFANMGTGEILYTYTYTYYSKREATFASLSDDSATVGLYRDTFDSLLEKVVTTAKQEFRPFSVSATVRMNWKGLYILDKGNSEGIVKGDTLVGPQSMPLEVLYASANYSVAKPLMGEPNTGMVFNKLSNGNLDELKKPKVMLMPGTTIARTGIPEQMVYQLFINALGKDAAFSLISVDKGFYDAQAVVTRETGLSQDVTRQRDLPDFFLRLSFAGPVSATVPSNKKDVQYDEHTARVCGDFLDRSGRALYGSCIDEKISDEVINGIRFAREDREEVVVKNGLIKLADDFRKSVKFRRFDLPVQPGEGDQLGLTDKAGLVGVGNNEQVFKTLKKVDGIDGEVQVPTWQVNVTARTDTQVELALLGGATPDLPKPAKGDKVIIEGLVTEVKDALSRFALCKNDNPEPAEGVTKQVYYSIVHSLGYPMYDGDTFNKALSTVKSAAYGFKPSTDEKPLPPTEIGYCIEPITKVALEKNEQKDGYSSQVFKVTAALKVHRGNNVVWKKGLQQTVTVSCPDGSEKEYVDFEVYKAICGLVSDLAKKVDVTAKQ